MHGHGCHKDETFMLLRPRILHFESAACQKNGEDAEHVLEPGKWWMFHATQLHTGVDGVTDTLQLHHRTASCGGGHGGAFPDIDEWPLSQANEAGSMPARYSSSPDSMSVDWRVGAAHPAWVQATSAAPLAKALLAKEVPCSEHHNEEMALLSMTDSLEKRTFELQEQLRQCADQIYLRRCDLERWRGTFAPTDCVHGTSGLDASMLMQGAAADILSPYT